MPEEKPKHKPQHKHTLSEVLKSLQDLIRTDLVPGRTNATPNTSTPTSPPAPNEPDSFNEALDNLDRIITERIIEPVERARAAPPEPLLPDETLEIAWDEAAPVESDDKEPPEAGRAVPATDSSNVAWPDETIELPPLIEEAASPTPEIPADTPLLPTAEAGFATPDDGLRQEERMQPAGEFPDAGEPAAGADGQRAFDFFESPMQPIAGPLTGRTADPGLSHQTSAEQDVFMSDDTVDKPASDAAERTEATATGAAALHAAAPDGETPVARNAADIPALTVEYTTDSVDASAEAPPGVEAPGTDDADRAEGARAVAAEPKLAGKAPENRQPQSAIAAEARARANDADSRRPAGSARSEGSGQEIPVLKEVADLNAPPPPPLPDVAQARDIAIRVIARLNIERRRNGEPPLDIKTIERLQQYLAEALTKRALNKPK